MMCKYRPCTTTMTDCGQDALRYPLHIPASISNSAQTLAQWNSLSPGQAARDILPCCGSELWALALAAKRPIADASALASISDEIWLALPKPEQQQAFDAHPRLGERQAPAATHTSLAWSVQEQRFAEPTEALREANLRYEQKFGRVFLLCAHGRSTPEILAAVESRMNNDPETEWREAVEQQRQITRLRLERWLEGTPA